MEGSINLAATPFAFLVFTVLAYVLFGIAKQMAPPFDPNKGKIAPYLCGEDFELGHLAPGYWQFFSIAILFTILHITVFMIALMPSGAVLFTLAYLVMVAAGVGVLIAEVRLTIPPKDLAIAKVHARAKVIDASTGLPVGPDGSITAID